MAYQAVHMMYQVMPEAVGLPSVGRQRKLRLNHEMRTLLTTPWQKKSVVQEDFFRESSGVCKSQRSKSSLVTEMRTPAIRLRRSSSASL